MTQTDLSLMISAPAIPPAGPILIPRSLSPDEVARLTAFSRWLDEEAIPWWLPDLERYRDACLERGLSPVSVSSYLGSIRARYRHLLLERDLWWRVVIDTSPDPLTRDQVIIRTTELVTIVENLIDPRSAPLKLVQHADRPDSVRVWLSDDQARRLIREPDPSTLHGLRDRAILATALYTGVREAELADLDMDDIDQTLNGQPAVWVREGKGSKARVIPWGAGLWVKALIRDWTRAAGITSGPVFRGVDRWDNVLGEKLSTRSVMRVAQRYPIHDQEGKVIPLTFHRLRATYARLCYQAGMHVDAIRQNMGHVRQSQTLDYIGPVDTSERITPTLL